MTDEPEFKPVLRYYAMESYDHFKATQAILQAIGALTALNDDDRFKQLLRELESSAMSLQRAYAIRGPIVQYLFTSKDIA